MDEKKKYTRSDKLKYYAARCAYHEYMLARAKERLEYIASEKYQEWDSDLAKELDMKKAAE